MGHHLFPPILFYSCLQDVPIHRKNGLRNEGGRNATKNKVVVFLINTLALRSLSDGVSVQMERSLFSGPDLFLNVRAPRPMCCNSGGSSVIHVSLVCTAGASYAPKLLC